jgi:uncharacterized protein YecE (DUF72 family)
MSEGPTFDRARMQRALGGLAAAGVYVGTSSWKYAGWQGQLYDESRYVYRGRWAESRFERDCLVEYGEVFKTVSVDAAYYRFPTRAYLEGLAAQVPDGFLFAFKVTDEITIRKFANLPRFGERAGRVNPNFLDAELFAREFLDPCAAIRPKVGLLLFEFSRFYPADFATGRDFVAALDGFLGRLPAGWPYAVEIRNRHFLHPEYFAMLARRGVTHVYNSWEAMPPVEEQCALAGSRTTPDRLAARFLLRPGRKYEEAVKRFSPYAQVQDVNAAGRAAGAALIRDGRDSGGRTRAFVFVNNRFEGSALGTIAAMLEQAGVPTG